MKPRRAGLRPRERYQLRLLTEYPRFYGTMHNVGGLVRQGYVARTGRTDEVGRAEWVITDAGRAALAMAEA